MPLFHTMGVRTLLASILVAGTWVPQARFDAEESLELISTSRSQRCLGDDLLMPTGCFSRRDV